MKFICDIIKNKTKKILETNNLPLLTYQYNNNENNNLIKEELNKLPDFIKNLLDEINIFSQILQSIREFEFNFKNLNLQRRSLEQPVKIYNF